MIEEAAGGYDEEPPMHEEAWFMEEQIYAMYDAFEPLLKAVMTAWDRHWSEYRGDLSMSDLDDKRPITLTIHCTLGDIRKARLHMRHEPPQEEEKF